MRHFYLALFGFLFSIITSELKSQGIEVDFSNSLSGVTVGETDTIDLNVSNFIDQQLAVINLKTFCADCHLSQDTVQVPFGQSRPVDLYFTPRHNIDYPVIIFAVPQNGLGTDAAAMLVPVTFKESYYSTTRNLWEEPLKQALNDIISSPYVNLGYSGARDDMFMTIDNQKVNGQGASVNTLECVYTGTLVTGYNDRQDAQNQGFNTEHTFPQGTFNSNEPMRADLHHLFPTTISSNSERGNKPFGIVNNPTWQVGGSKSNSSTFEPRDQQKGPAARAMLYFLVRYRNYQNYVNASEENVLKQWGLQYAPTDAERNRNDAVEKVQRNRNPFTDYPQLIERISIFRSNSGTYSNTQLAVAIDTLMVSGTDKATQFDRNIAIANNGNIWYTVAAQAGGFSGSASATVQTARQGDTLAPGEAGVVELSFSVTQPTDTGYVEVQYGAGQTKRIIIIAQPGRYIPTGRPMKKQPAVALYPNPASAVLHWQGIQPGRGVAVQVVSAMGNIVWSATDYTANQLSIRSLAGGYYWLRLYHQQWEKPAVIPFIKL